ncbi:MAG: hypothetical protein HY473_02005 [Candidatus Sungbacteria bacterium]|uniref:Uncharacterized protein n=1 Tax=Candidatus Sungiibacteriota bacterium TaxID=2750080 RepID=A0A933DTF6_9BACT|nr:hypothetical protein [Candidatus Sungbacteria bacterium]
MPGDDHIETPLHPAAHLSDYGAQWLVRRYGREKYGRPIPGNRVVIIGRGGYDEHDPAYLPDPTSRERECEATLVAKDLGVFERPELREVLEYTLAVDAFGQGKGVLKLGRLVEQLHNTLPSWRVEQWTELLLDAMVFSVLEWERFLAVAPSRETVLSLLKSSFDRATDGFAHEATKHRLQEVVDRYRSQRLWAPFCLPHCMAVVGAFLVRRLSRRRTSRALVAWAQEAFLAELEWQRRYFEAAQDHDRAEECSLMIRGEEVIVYFIHSDQQRIHSRFFHESQWIVLVVARRSTGHVQIFRRRSAPLRISTESVVAFLRSRELEKLGEPPAQWKDLVSPAGPEGAGRKWFYHKPTESIFNGGLTAPDVVSTLLTDEEIRDCIIRGLDDQYLPTRRQFSREQAEPRS